MHTVNLDTGAACVTFEDDLSWGSMGWEVITSAGPAFSLVDGQFFADSIDNVHTKTTIVREFVLPEAPEAWLDFYLYQQVQESGDCAYDTTRVYAEIVGTGEIVELFLACDSGIVTPHISLGAFAGNTIQLKFQFDTIDDIANDADGAYLDDFLVTTCP